VRCYAIFPYWVHALIAASLTIAFILFMLWLHGSWDEFHRPWIGFGGIFAVKFGLLAYIEYRSRQFNREQNNGNSDLHQG